MKLFAAAVLFAVSAFGQTVEMSNCVYRGGDDPAWAAVGYDDSGWARTPNGLPGGLWMRCRGTLPVKTSPLYVQLNLSAAWELYANGRKIGTFGDPASGFATADTIQQRQIPAEPARGELLIAVRVGDRPLLYRLLSKPVLGTAQELEVSRFEVFHDAILEGLGTRVASYAMGIAGLILLILSIADQKHRETLWLGIFCLRLLIYQLADVPFTFQLPLPIWMPLVLWWLSQVLNFALPWFIYAFQGKPVPAFYRWLRVIVAAAYLPLLVDPFVANGALTPARIFVLNYVAVPLGFVNTACLITAFLPYRNRSWPEWLAVVVGGIWALATGVPLFVQLPWIGQEIHLYGANNLLSALRTPAIIFFIVLLALRFRRVGREREQLRSDMDAARNVQQRLVPAQTDIPGYEIATAYVPANDVGGDFYQCLPAADGSLLVVVGDVSGKGLDAAMLVATVIGALGDLASRQPAEVLAHLNRAILGKTGGGFVTCGCALFDGNGNVEFANAGHISPYMDGSEVEVDSAPPLGIIADMEYETTTRLALGTVTFLSDGVVEARNGAGELLGFERTGPLTAKPASVIAEEARRWGQDDDITVVQVSAKLSPREATACSTH